MPDLITDGEDAAESPDAAADIEDEPTIVLDDAPDAPDGIGVVYDGPHGSVTDGDATFPRGQTVRTHQGHLDRLRDGLPGHRFRQVP